MGQLIMQLWQRMQVENSCSKPSIELHPISEPGKGRVARLGPRRDQLFGGSGPPRRRTVGCQPQRLRHVLPAP